VEVFLREVGTSGFLMMAGWATSVALLLLVKFDSGGFAVLVLDKSADG